MTWHSREVNRNDVFKETIILMVVVWARAVRGRSCVTTRYFRINCLEEGGCPWCPVSGVAH